MNYHDTTKVRHDALVNGDLAWIEGHLFRVRNLRHYEDQDHRDGAKPGDKVTVYRFEGELVFSHDTGLEHTSYNGGTYGARADVLCTIVRRDQ